MTPGATVGSGGRSESGWGGADQGLGGEGRVGVGVG